MSEFEYACALLRIRGLEDVGWDPLEETHQLVADMLSLIYSPLRDSTRVRLALLTYCHLTEVDAIYAILDNMLTTIEGGRCSTEPFRHLYGPAPKAPEARFTPPRPPSAKRVVEHLKEHSDRVGETELAGTLDQMFDEQIRNSFFHSDYILYGGEYRTREGRFHSKDIGVSALPLEELTARINRGLGFYYAFMANYTDHVHSYTEPKVVHGRFLADGATEVPIQLLATPERGLYGFRTPPSAAPGDQTLGG